MTALIMAALCLVQAGSLTRERIDTVRIEPGGRIKVSNVNGEIDVRGWDKDYVEIRSTMTTERDSSELGRVAVKIESGDPLVIETKYEKRRPGEKSPDVSVDYAIRVPAGAGKISVAMVNGDVVMAEIPGGAGVSCVNGDVILQEIGGPVDAECVNGDITVSGSAQVHEIMTVSGDIKVMVASPAAGDVDLCSVSGSIRIGVDPDVNAEIDLETLSGGLAVRGLDLGAEKETRHHVRGKLNQGGARISASTVSGSITVVAEE